jgi:hypothetical protein
MPSLIESIRGANRRLGSQLETLSARQAAHSAVLRPENMAALLSELLSAGASLRAQPLPTRGIDDQLDRELDEYRLHVERLRGLLPSLHQELLAERARLEARRSRVVSVTEWARASRQTL